VRPHRPPGRDLTQLVADDCPFGRQNLWLVGMTRSVPAADGHRQVTLPKDHAATPAQKRHELARNRG
jgi:hypothetical protein